MKRNITKIEAVPDDAMLPHYDFRGGVRGKYARDYARGENLRILAPDLLKDFPDSECVNEALRTLARMSGTIAQQPKPKRKKHD